MSEAVRLNRFIAQAGVCSRRKADRLIEQGLVQVNHEPVRTMGRTVDPEKDLVTVEGREVKPARTAELVYLLLNKPPSVVTTVSDPEKRRTVMDFIPDRYRVQRLVPAGRLDFFSEGLLVLTNDGLLVHRMTHPSWKQPKVYEVTVREKPTEEMLNIMARGMTLGCGRKLAPVRSRLLRGHSGAWVLEMTLYQGINRQIRRMCQDLGLTILKLVRMAQGPLYLGNLASGRVRELRPAELKALKKSAGISD